PELVKLLRRLGHDVPADSAFTDPTETAASTSIGQLFVPEFRRDTLALCLSFFFCLMAAYGGVFWLPTLLRGSGFDIASASNGLLTFNLGGVLGALIGATLISRFGSRVTMLSMCVGAVAGSALIASMSVGTQPTLMVFALIAWTGGLINGAQTTMYALAAHVYPAAIRATGVGTAVAFGRVGGVLSSFAGSAALTPGGSRYFMMLAALMSLVFVALAAVRRHILPMHRQPARAYVEASATR
ncbi:MAG: MFS transporter, partial [Vicinamibacterales bacterium]